MAITLDGLSEVSRFADAELLRRLKELVKADQALSAKLLVHLGEVDARGLYRELSYGSMFGYCVTALQMSEAEAYLRIHAARLGRRFPLVVERLGDIITTRRMRVVARRRQRICASQEYTTGSSPNATTAETSFGTSCVRQPFAGTHPARSLQNVSNLDPNRQPSPSTTTCRALIWRGL